jgi:peptidoglycan/LPS O-acetylase OafA/YrhL
MNFETMSKQRKFVLIAAGIGVISMFLPWVSAYSSSVNGMHGSGILVFLCFAACVAFALMGNQTRTMDKNYWMITLIAAGLATLIIVWNLIDAMNKGYGSYLSFGVYLAALAAIGTLAAAFIYRSPNDSIKDGFSNLKKDIQNQLKQDDHSRGAGTGTTGTGTGTTGSTGTTGTGTGTTPL